MTEQPRVIGRIVWDEFLYEIKPLLIMISMAAESNQAKGP